MALTYPAGTTPVIPVLQSDTFEIQRQKINNLALASTGPTFLAAPVLIINIAQSQSSYNWFPTGATNANASTAGTITTAGAIPASGTWTTFSLVGTGVPSTALSLIIEASSNTDWADSSSTNPFYVFVRQNSTVANTYPVLRTGVGYGGNAGQVVHSQGAYPVGQSQTLDWAPFYGTVKPVFGLVVRIIGYY